MIVVSSGHSAKVQGANGIINEVTEARRVVKRICEILHQNVIEFHDNTSTTQSTNLKTIVDFHNKQKRNLDVSIHFNAFQRTKVARGVEVLFYSEKDLANKLSASISKASKLKNRGGKRRTDLAFLSDTTKPAIIIEVCFVDSEEDVKLYKKNFESICHAIADAINERNYA